MMEADRVDGASMGSVSIYFPAGDFVDVMRRYEKGDQQVYQTHNEAARLFHDLLAAKCRVNLYSFISLGHCEQHPLEDLKVVALGAKNFNDTSILREAIAKDDAEAIVIHFPHLELLRGALPKKARVCVVLGNSFNRSGPRSMLNRWRIVSLLNNSRIELVSNHCRPATEHLARIGVNPEKLVPWDVARPFDPLSQKPKELAHHHPIKSFYAGSITRDKGIPDLIRAIGLLRTQGIDVQCSLAGYGEIEEMKALSASVDVADLISFTGQIGNAEVFGLMGAADLVFIPSRKSCSEGFPLTIFEASASRTPIVCSDHPMFRGVMIDGRNASVFPAGNSQAFAAAICRTVTDRALYKRLSENATLTWAALKGCADWRTLIYKWVVEGKSSAWICDHMLSARKD